MHFNDKVVYSNYLDIRLFYHSNYLNPKFCIRFSPILITQFLLVAKLSHCCANSAGFHGLIAHLLLPTLKSTYHDFLVFGLLEPFCGLCEPYVCLLATWCHRLIILLECTIHEILLFRLRI